MKKFSTSSEGIEKVAKIVIEKIEVNRENYIITSRNTTSTIFLAGAPGSGKTEFILSLKSKRYFFIDIDSYRNYFVGYKGENSQNYQKAISGVVDRVIKYCFQNDIRFILDGTFKSLKHVKRNVENCKKKKRKIKIYFIFQNPYVSYYYTFLRKMNNERNIPVEGFIECFYESIRNIFIVKGKYESIDLSICEKNNFLEKIITEKSYKIRKDIDDIEKFCKLYGVGYNSGEFRNRESLKKGMYGFENLLYSYKFLVKLHRKYLDFKRMLGKEKKKDS